MREVENLIPEGARCLWKGERRRERQRISQVVVYCGSHSSVITFVVKFAKQSVDKVEM